MDAAAGPAASLNTVLVWFRRDLRVEDNPALTAALQSAPIVIPVFIWAPEEEGQFQPGRSSRWWLKRSLSIFQQHLRDLGSRLIVRRADETQKALVDLVRETGAQGVFFNHLYDPISLVRDHEVKQAMGNAGVFCRSYNADLLYEPWEVLDEEEEPFTCFKDFWNRVVAMPYQPPYPLSAPTALPKVGPDVKSLDIQELDWFFTPEQEASADQLRFKWKPGIEGASEKLEQFLDKQLYVFEHERAKVDRDSTTQLSPWIHCGTVSVRYIYYRVRAKQAAWAAAGDDRAKSCNDFLQQVGYREYSRYLSFHFPFIHERALLAHLRACPWRVDQFAFKAWKQGLTGYPLVDAGMKQLWSTGWMHNRLRVVAASFMVKNLLLPWQWGLKYYWDALLDADLECDALGWQYVSGCMADAKPFSYMMDLDKEALRFDPDGEYVRRWLPVLARVPTQYIHAPWKAPDSVLAAADVELGFNYPYPIVTNDEAAQHVRHACSVIDKCSSGDALPRHPYRPATDPGLSNALVGTAQQSLIMQARPARIAGYHPLLKRGMDGLAVVDASAEPDQDEAMSDEEVVSNMVDLSEAGSVQSTKRAGVKRSRHEVSIAPGFTVPTISNTTGVVPTIPPSGTGRSSDRPCNTVMEDESPPESPESGQPETNNEQTEQYTLGPSPKRQRSPTTIDD